MTKNTLDKTFEKNQEAFKNVKCVQGTCISRKQKMNIKNTMHMKILIIYLKIC